MNTLFAVCAIKKKEQSMPETTIVDIPELLAPKDDNNSGAVIFTPSLTNSFPYETATDSCNR